MIQEKDAVSSVCPILSQTVHEQQRGTCYAHAAATVLASAEKRIVGRVIKDHDTIVSEITAKYGFNGGDAGQVLTDECKKRGLRFERIEKIEEAQFWIKKRHALFASFFLQKNQWTNLSQFLKKKPEGILTLDDLNQLDDSSDESDQSEADLYHSYQHKGNSADQKGGGHAVVIGDYNEKEKYWLIKNSWGEKSGDHGYWRVSVDKGLNLTFYHVYFLLGDLTEMDIVNYVIKYGFNQEIEQELYRRGAFRELVVKTYFRIFHSNMKTSHLLNELEQIIIRIKDFEAQGYSCWSWYFDHVQRIYYSFINPTYPYYIIY